MRKSPWSRSVGQASLGEHARSAGTTAAPLRPLPSNCLIERLFLSRPLTGSGPRSLLRAQARGAGAAAAAAVKGGAAPAKRTLDFRRRCGHPRRITEHCRRMRRRFEGGSRPVATRVRADGYAALYSGVSAIEASPTRDIASACRTLAPVISRMIEWCTMRSTAAAVVIGSLNI